jgi:uncharacterized SAM-binding protein YcdF (DUF218 family)
MLLTFSYGAVPHVLLRSLENAFPPLINLRENHDVKWVVVLGGGHISDSELPVTGQIGVSTLARLVEGIRIYKELQDCKLLLSGGAVYDPKSNAEIMAEVALLLGAQKDDLLLDTDSKDTKDQARIIHQLLGDDEFILVTSASHMPRSIALFRKKGMKPVPAPADHLVRKYQEISPAVFFPRAAELKKMERVFYEYLGILWAKLRGQI